MADSDLLQAAIDAGGLVSLEPRRYALDRPLAMPATRGLTIAGCGMGVSELRLVGTGDCVLTGVRDQPAGAVTLRDFSVHPGDVSRAGGAITVTAPRLFEANRAENRTTVATEVSQHRGRRICHLHR